MIDFGEQCSWCGHLDHDGECEGTIQTGSGKNPETKSCPCVRRKQ